MLGLPSRAAGRWTASPSTVSSAASGARLTPTQLAKLRDMHPKILSQIENGRIAYSAALERRIVHRRGQALTAHTLALGYPRA